MSGLKRQANFGDVFEKRGFDVWCIDTKEKILSNASGTQVGFLLGLSLGGCSSYAKSKARKKHNGKKYAIRFASVKSST